MSRSRRQTSFGERVWSVPGTLLCLLAVLVGPFHALLVEHEPCLEHGEFVHVSSEGSSVAGRPLARGDDPVLASARSAVVHRADEHCAVLGSAQAQTGTVRAGWPIPPPEGEAVSFIQPATFPRASVPVLHLAPKASPPAQA